MDDRAIVEKRVQQFADRLREQYYGDRAQLSVEFCAQDEPIPVSDVPTLSFSPISPGEAWATQWGSAWFRLSGTVPPAWSGSEVVALIDLGGEACVFRDDSPWMGLTNKGLNDGSRHRKRRVPVGVVNGGEKLEYLVEAAANELMGVRAIPERYRLLQAELAQFDRELWQIVLDVDFLLELANALPGDAPRTRRIVAGLNDCVSTWNEGAGRAAVRSTLDTLLRANAHASALTAWSTGHGHIDLGWLWPVRETRRKGGRTFATALRLMDEYPDYTFGASQPQLYEWIREDYPGLFREIKQSVKDGRWECQGAMWVEPDMNLPSGESLVRQCLYGKKFFRDEFDVDVRNLWLPDVFGYSAALPQILRGCGVDLFMTQKISWNEINTFPHHTFLWEGIDGTRIHSHFLPTNTYNFENDPQSLVSSEKRFAQAERINDFLNLFGTGDGGGGPSRKHIEYARRAQDTEGLPKVKMAPAESFFETVRQLPEESLPLWRGELYLEKHRGTYTTQARIKKANRHLEHLLHDVELLEVLCEKSESSLASAWKDTLLNQFHDILPGSSIEWVYRDAQELSNRNLNVLSERRSALLCELLGIGSAADVQSADERIPVSWPHDGSAVRMRIFNPLAWARRAVLEFEMTGDAVPELEASERSTGAIVHGVVHLPPAGYTTIEVTPNGMAQASEDVTPSEEATASADGSILENTLLRVVIGDDGTLESIYRKDLEREYLRGPANCFTLWEDRPHSYDAWDINHYYRETVPEQAHLVSRRIVKAEGARATLLLIFSIGESTIRQLICLDAGSAHVHFQCVVDWQESHRHLRVGAQVAIRSNSARYEIQYGTVERPTHMNTSWDEARFEVPAHRFADLSQPDAGFAILNDSKYGHRIVGSDVELTLLRSPKSPDPNADIGEQTFSYAYFAHAGERDRSAVLRAAHELNAPNLVVPEGQHPFEGPPERSWFSIIGDGVKLETVKIAEDRNGIVVRLYEFNGTTPEVTLSVPGKYRRASETDMLERGDSPVGVHEGSVSLTFHPFEIKTLRLTEVLQ